MHYIKVVDLMIIFYIFFLTTEEFNLNLCVFTLLYITVLPQLKKVTNLNFTTLLLKV